MLGGSGYSIGGIKINGFIDKLMNISVIIDGVVIDSIIGSFFIFSKIMLVEWGWKICFCIIEGIGNGLVNVIKIDDNVDYGEGSNFL